MTGTQMVGGSEQGFWRWLADGLQRFSLVCCKNCPCEVYVKLCHMFSVMKILLKQNIEAKESAKETKPISKCFGHETPGSASVRYSEIPVPRTRFFFF